MQRQHFERKQRNQLGQIFLTATDFRATWQKYQDVALPLRAGLAALMDGYRTVAATEPQTYLDAARLVGELTDHLQFNPNEELALQALFVSLPRRR